MLCSTRLCGRLLAQQGTKLVSRRQIYVSVPSLKKMKKEWVQDQSQREVDAILQAKRISGGPSKKPLRLLTFEDDEIGIMKKFEAERIADERNLKLVPLDTASDPMIFKLMNGKQLAEFNRSNKKPKKKDIKKLLLTLNIGEKDLLIKLDHVEDWLKHGLDVDVEVKSKKLVSDPDVGALQSKMFQKLTERFCELATVHQATRTDASLRIVLTNKSDASQQQKN